MKASFKARFWKVSKWFGALFILLFVFRLIYGYVETDTGSGDDYSSDFFSSLGNIRKNYASEKFSNNMQVQPAMESNQKFEKTASIKTKSSEFEKDENTIKAKTKAYHAVIQYEQNIGLKGKREIHLLIGVSPVLFDSFYIDIQKAGVIKAAEITKVDKTNEFKQLNAKRASLEKTLQSLLELKTRGGEITDFVSLHDKILEIEEKLQELGVELGNFDAENEFCTVKLSLFESAAQKKVSFIHRLKIAFEWSVKYFALSALGLLIVSLVIFTLLLIIDKLNLIKAISSKIDE